MGLGDNLGNNVLAGFQAGAGSTAVSGIGGFIREKLAMAKSKNLGAFKQGLETESAIQVAQAEGGKTKKVFQSDAAGNTIPITFGDGETDFAKGDTVFSPEQGKTEGERRLASEKAGLKADILKKRREAEGGGENVITQSAGDNLADATGSGIAGQQVEARRQAIEFLKSNGAPVTEANITAVLQQKGA